MKANKPCSGHLVDRGGYYHTVIYVLENGKRKPVSRTTGLPVKNNLRKAQKILEDRKREYDEMGLAGMLSLEERDRFASMPLADYMRYVFDHKPNLTAPTKIGYLNTINGRIDKFFGPRGVTISSITPKHIEDFIEYLADDGLCGTTQHDYVKLIGTCLRYAVRKDHILRNPMDKVDMPKKSKSHAQFYTQQEAEKLLEAARGTEIYIPVLLATFYGLRRSEVCGVQWDSIDWENDQIHIDHKVYEDSLQEGNPIVITDQMKTESSRRTLPLIPYVKEELLRHRKQLEANRKAFRNGYSKKWLNCVCVDSLGNLIIPDKLTQRFGNLLKANGLRHIRFHDLRHSCASFLVSSGIPMKQVQLFLGHSNYSTTADIYAHLSPNALDASGATMQSLLAPKAAETGKEVVPV